jgi:hypothetical protein
MDKIFYQEELYWLDDILPGTKIGQIRRFSTSRNVYIPKSSENSNNPSRTVSDLSDKKYFSEKTNNFYPANIT